MAYSTKCPVCLESLDRARGATNRGVLQHHFLLSHGIELIRSHQLANAATTRGLNSDEIGELKQLRLPL